MEKWLKQFENPSAEYRPHPFWSWNDRLEENELREQIKLMAQSGHGGFYMHARDGIETPYMGDEWFDCVKACMDEAEKEGLEAWCYDETGWPSGSAGGVIPKMRPENPQHILRCLPINKGEDTRGIVLAFYGVNADLTYNRILADNVDDAYSALIDGQKLYYATAIPDGGYIDVLNASTVKDFIDYTHEKYDALNPGAFRSGKLAGFFTDEPEYTLCKTPWTTVAPKEFTQRYGYDIKDHIVALFLETPNKEAIRFDYWKMVADLFCNSFMKQIYDWCEAHGTQLTGHVMMEDNLLCQIHCTAGAMPLYEHMHIPGVDWLGRSPAPSKVNQRRGLPIVPLQVGSVAAQLGQKHVLTESFAMSGWDASFADLRHVLDWQYLSGVNYTCQHLAGYSTRGRRKNDYPCGMFYQSPFWKDYKIFNDTISRMGMILTDSHCITDTLMIHPMHSLWIKYTNDDLCAEDVFDTFFMETSMKLYEYHIPYHYGDETIIAKHGKVENGKFIIGNCAYSTVLIPWMYGMDRKTYELLNEFVDQGGRLALISEKGKTPDFIDGRYAKEELDALMAKAQKADIFNEEAFLTFINKNGINKVIISDKDGVCQSIHYNCREFDDGKKVYFFVNMDEDHAHRVKITLDEKYMAEILLDTMKLVSHPTTTRDGKLELDVIFEPIESHMFITSDEPIDAPLAHRYVNTYNIPLSKDWKIASRSDSNTMLLEYCRVLNNDGTWSDLLHTLNAQSAAFAPGIRQIAPAIKYSFNIAKGTNLKELADVCFVSEFKLPVTLTINGTKVEHAEGEWWFDHHFSVYHIGNYLKEGENDIIVTDISDIFEKDGNTIYGNRAEFGNMYLKGNFGVYSDAPFIDSNTRAIYTDGNWTITNRPTQLDGGEIVHQGHAFFAGTIVLSQDVEIDITEINRSIDLGCRPFGSYAFVIVNGNRSDIIAWNESTVDVTPYLKKGTNTIEIEITIGNRNLLGPHHFFRLGETGAGPGDFYPYNPAEWQKRYSFVKAGLID